MLIGRVIGEVVATHKHASHEGRKVLVVQPLNLDGSDRGDAVLALDAVDAGVGDRILLATDGSECSQLAARSVAERPWPAATTVRILSVAELSIPLFKLPYFSSSTMERLRADAMQRAEEAEMAAQELLTNVGIEESGTVAVPTLTPKELIVQNAEDWGADLIVCGSHGRRGASRIWLGSVSESIASHAKCSVEIIRQVQP